MKHTSNSCLMLTTINCTQHPHRCINEHGQKDYFSSCLHCAQIKIKCVSNKINTCMRCNVNFYQFSSMTRIFFQNASTTFLFLLFVNFFIITVPPRSQHMKSSPHDKHFATRTGPSCIHLGMQITLKFEQCSLNTVKSLSSSWQKL